MANTCHLIIAPDPRQGNFMQTSPQPYFDIKFGSGSKYSTYRRAHSSFAYTENKSSKSKQHEVLDEQGQLRQLNNSQYLEWLVFEHTSDHIECEPSEWHRIHRIHPREDINIEDLALLLSGLLDEFSRYDWNKTEGSRFEDLIGCIRDNVIVNDSVTNLDDIVKAWLGQGKRIRCIS